MTDNIYLKKLREKESDLTDKLNAIRKLIEEELIESKETGIKLINVVTNENISNDVFNKSNYGGSIKEKFINVLKQEQRFMKVREIAEVICKAEGGDVNSVITTLSRNTKILKDLKKIVHYQIGNSRKNTFWGSPKWLDSNGEIIAQYKFSDKALKTSSSSSIKDLDI